MIIKSMSRKDKSFAQLINYMADIDKSDEQYNIYHNLYARNLDDVEAEFMHNAEYVHKRKNGVYMYHEILSITKAEHLDEAKQKVLLRQIAYQYAQQRADNNLIFATLHDDHDHHLHYHFLISSNAVGDSKKTRLSKTQFDRFKKDLEKYTLEHFPELEQQVVINRQANEKLSRKGGERKRRTGKTPQRDILKNKLSHIFENAATKQEFFTALNELQLELYVRGKSIGVRDTENNRKHRIKTLGLDEAFKTMSERIDLDEASNTTKQAFAPHKRAQDTSNTEKTNTQTDSDFCPGQNNGSSEQAKDTADSTHFDNQNPRQEQPQEPLSDVETKTQQHKADIDSFRKSKINTTDTDEEQTNKHSSNSQQKK